MIRGFSNNGFALCRTLISEPTPGGVFHDQRVLWLGRSMAGMFYAFSVVPFTPAYSYPSSAQMFHTTFSPHLPVEVCAEWPSQGLTLVKVQPDDGSSGVREQDPQAQPGEAWHSAASLGSLAYALHTSGTTGLPKTVRVPHHCIVPNILHLRSGSV